MRARRAALGAIFGLLLAGVTCSLQNQEGPSVTCAELACGRINACQDSIIAACLDGERMQYHVCTPPDSKDVCAATWQVAGQYRCEQYGIDCEGCRPERAGCAEDAGAEAAP